VDIPDAAVLFSLEIVRGDFVDATGGGSRDQSDLLTRALGVLDRELSARRRASELGLVQASNGNSSSSPTLDEVRALGLQLVDHLITLAQSVPNNPAAPSLPSGSTLIPLAAADLPTLTSRVPARAGQVASVFFRAVNEGAAAPLRFVCTDLASASGARIPATATSFSPELPFVGEGKSLPVRLHIAVPKEAAPGKYLGLVQGLGRSAGPAVLSLDVTK
jgi:hypothetical protein